MNWKSFWFGVVAMLVLATVGYAWRGRVADEEAIRKDLELEVALGMVKQLDSLRAEWEEEKQELAAREAIREAAIAAAEEEKKKQQGIAMEARRREGNALRRLRAQAKNDPVILALADSLEKAAAAKDTAHANERTAWQTVTDSLMASNADLNAMIKKQDAAWVRDREKLENALAKAIASRDQWRDIANRPDGVFGFMGAFKPFMDGIVCAGLGVAGYLAVDAISDADQIEIGGQSVNTGAGAAGLLSAGSCALGRFALGG